MTSFMINISLFIYLIIGESISISFDNAFIAMPNMRNKTSVLVPIFSKQPALMNNRFVYIVVASTDVVAEIGGTKLGPKDA